MRVARERKMFGFRFPSIGPKERALRHINNTIGQTMVLIILRTVNYTTRRTGKGEIAHKISKSV